jgi:hypothetical protein
MSAEWETLSETEKDGWREKATEYLLSHGWIPLTDDVWATDLYSDQIEVKAQELWDSSLI